jgi:mono/diheme cytochrome c family protein
MAVCFIVAMSLTKASVTPAHGPGHEMSEHLRAMQALKERIPLEYRIMDRTPVTPTEASLARGQALFAQYCAVCHGQEGRGDGPAGKAMTPPPANFLDIPHSGIYGPGEKFWIIGNGSPETGMPGFASQLEPLDRWHLVNVILSLQTEHGKPNEHRGH